METLKVHQRGPRGSNFHLPKAGLSGYPHWDVAAIQQPLTRTTWAAYHRHLNYLKHGNLPTSVVGALYLCWVDVRRCGRCSHDFSIDVSVRVYHNPQTYWRWHWQILLDDAVDSVSASYLSFSENFTRLDLLIVGQTPSYSCFVGTFCGVTLGFCTTCTAVRGRACVNHKR